MPGSLMQINAAWDDDPKADFIYGKYRFFSEDLQVYPSRSWNPYVLQSMNYVSTMSPMKREVWEKNAWLPEAFGSMAQYGFNEELKWFQDWDFFLRAAMQGKRGKFLNDVIFQTDFPDKESISGNPETSFMDRVKHIKRINNVPYRPICVTTFGAPFQAEYRAEVLGADYLGANMATELAWYPGMWGQHDYKLVYCIGFYPKAVDAHAMMFQNAPEGSKRLIHWIGTDVHQLRVGFNWVSIKAMKDDVLSKVDYQATTSPGLTEELDEIGIEAPTIYAPIEAERFPILAAPKSFAVGCYVSDTNPMHNEQFLQDVAKSMPDIKFIFFGRNQKDKSRNIEYVGRVENMRDVLMETSVNLRMTVHDGMPQTVLQYLMSGRQAVCNTNIEGATLVPMSPTESEYSAVKSRVIYEIQAAKRRVLSKEEKIRVREHWATITDPETYRKAIYGFVPSAEDELGLPDVQPGGLSGDDGGLHPGANG